MTQEKWEQILGMVEEKFGIEKRERKELEPSGTLEAIEFTALVGKMRLEYCVRPKLLDTKTTYSHRLGASVVVEKVYSEDEFVSFLNAYRFDEASGQWMRFEAERMF